MKKRTRFCLILGTAVTLTACSSPSGSTAPAFGAAAPESVVMKTTTAPTLYVLNQAESEATVSVFSGNSASYLRTLQLGAYEHQRASLATDNNGHFYASPTTQGAQTLNAYASRGSRIWHTIEQKKTFYYVTLDSQNNVYTACSDTKICEYAALKAGGRQKLLWSIGMRQFGQDFGQLAVDSAGDLAVSSGNAVRVFSHGAKTPSLTIATTNLESGAIMFDANNDLYVATTKGINIYAPGTTTPMRTITQGFAVASQLAFDGRGNLYVANMCGAQCGSTPASICVFAPGGQQPALTITTGITDGFTGMAVSASGYVYAVNGSEMGSLVIYAPGDVKPKKTITKNIESPTAVVVGS
jgi:hypothetical protein